MLHLEDYLKEFDGKIMTQKDVEQKGYIDTPMNEKELKNYKELKPLLEKIVELENEINSKAFNIYKNDRTFKVFCSIDEPYRRG